jgi:hypothetical protein
MLKPTMGFQSRRVIIWYKLLSVRTYQTNRSKANITSIAAIFTHLVNVVGTEVRLGTLYSSTADVVP